MKPKADEYNVFAVAVDGYYAGMWHEIASFETKADAYDYAENLSRKRYRMAGVQPQDSSMKPFYTHPLTVVWE